ncbi:hypothetical protein CAPTEDRAFT_120055 [Capitella teleta]|uniref:NmrA-like family domain-containing protein 1 n=1 Tax=Capitella teleta TaxID=283909 RepID=R7TIM1_CAPTE|nr:hypothetical protein CAPTEDRAFT_120055 [Capitella teleta]|eukprot:ELT90935.1 hypothetical protein CAPTEDRAFT_120055 [Capitella teleta]
MGCKQSKDKEGTEENAAAEGAAEQGAEASGQPKVVVVFGATGRQGGSVVRALHGDATYKVRAVTRDPESEKAKALAEMDNVEVVKADYDDCESLKAAFDGAYAAYVVTDYLAVMDQEKETQQGKNAVDAAKAAGVKHFIYSGLPSGTEAGKACRFMDSKAAVEEHLKTEEVPFTILHLPAYYEILLTTNKPIKKDDGSYALDFPMGDVALPMICVSQIGECVHQILLKEDEFKSKTLALASQELKVDEYAAILTKGIHCGFVFQLTIDELAQQEGNPLAEDLAALFANYASGKLEFNIETTRSLNPDIMSFESWVEANKEELEKVLE